MTTTRDAGDVVSKREEARRSYEALGDAIVRKASNDEIWKASEVWQRAHDAFLGHAKSVPDEKLEDARKQIDGLAEQNQRLASKERMRHNKTPII